MSTKESSPKQQLIIKHAGSLGRAFAEINAEFAHRYPEVELTSTAGGSASLVREVVQGTECSVLASADYGLIARFVLPNHAGWYIQFASSEMALRYSDQSLFSQEITTENWFRILERDGVTFWHSDPDEDPGGYRALMVLQLAEKHYRVPGLYDRLMTPVHNRIVTRATAAESALGYSFGYGTAMGPPGSKFIRLPDEVNLSKASLSNLYAQAVVSIPVREGERIALHGESLLFGVTVPATCPDEAVSVEWLRLLLGDVGRAALEKSGLVPLRPAIAIGAGIPGALREHHTVAQSGPLKGHSTANTKWP